MLPNAKVCLYPRDPTEAARILSERGRQALAIAGGTTAALSRDPNVTTLVDLTRLGYDTIERSEQGWSIGCNVRIQELASHPEIGRLWSGMLTECARSVGSRPIRNAATVGGNAIALFRWSDPPVAYLAMEATFTLVGPRGERALLADQLFSRHPRQVLEPGEIMTSLRIRAPGEKHGGAFTKLARTAFDLAIVNAAVCMRFDGATCSGARVVVGATRTLPWRALDAEAELVGKEPSRAAVSAAARAAREATRTADDIRTQAQYRKEMVEVVVRRTIEKAVQRTRGSGTA
jgi:CO/xanthine dehydrogenase FAD-binding subunit